MSLTRRAFIKYSLKTSLLLSLPQLSLASKRSGLRFISDQDLLFFRAIIPVLLNDSGYTQKEFDQVVQGVDTTISYLGKDIQEELSDLLALMGNRLSRVVVTGLWANWDEASDKDINTFMNNWKAGNLESLGDAYIGLHDLILGSWYSTPQSWPSIHYPGPVTITGQSPS